MAATTPTPLSADLEHGLRRLKLASMRRVAPELLVTAKTQRWTPEELLRALVEVEITARDASNTQRRTKQASFPTLKTIEQFDLSASSIPAPTWAYLSSLEWISAKENLTLIGPAGTGKSHALIALGHAAVDHGLRVRYFTAAELVENLYRGLADNSVGKVIENSPPSRPDHLRRGRLRAAGQHRQSTAVPLRRRRLRTPQPRDRQPLAVRGMGPLPARPQHRRQPARPSPAPQQHRRHRRRELPHARGPQPVRRTPLEPLNPSREVGTFSGHQRGPRVGH